MNVNKAVTKQKERGKLLENIKERGKLLLN